VPICNITIADAFATCQLGHRTDAAANQGVEAAAGSLDFLEQHRIAASRCLTGASMANLISTQRRLIRSGNSRMKTQPCGRFGGAAAGVSGTSDGIIRRPFGRRSTRLFKTIGDYRLEQIFSSGIGQQALPQALCFSQ
jgi:hypothetical protein